MVMRTAQRRWTARMVRDLPDDGNRYEVVDGVLLVTPAPSSPHQNVITRLVVALGNYLAQSGRMDALFTSPADISWALDVLVQPDIFVVAPDEVSGDWSPFKTLLLAVEVL